MAPMSFQKRGGGYGARSKAIDQRFPREARSRDRLGPGSGGHNLVHVLFLGGSTSHTRGLYMRLVHYPSGRCGTFVECVVMLTRRAGGGP